MPCFFTLVDVDCDNLTLGRSDYNSLCALVTETFVRVSLRDVSDI